MKIKKNKYQERYLKHQERKRDILKGNYGTSEFKVYSQEERDVFFEILKNRGSQRTFNEKEIMVEDFSKIITAIDTAPSSCNRKGISVAIVTSREDKEVLSGLLVGGVGWMQRASVVLLLEGDNECYKSPAEKDNMPYLDAGVIIQTVYLACEALNIGCCYVNPNVREKNKEFFRKRFGIEGTFCGAIVLGYYDKKN